MAQDEMAKWFGLVGGNSNALKSRLTEPEAALRVWAKTGNMYFVSSLAGYIFMDNSDKYLFVIFANNKSKRSLIDSELNYGERKKLIKQARGWAANARELQNEIVRKWTAANR